MNTVKLLTVEEVASLLNVPKSTVYQWVHYKKIPFVKFGRRLNFSEEEIDKFIQSNTYMPDRL